MWNQTVWLPMSTVQSHLKWKNMRPPRGFSDGRPELYCTGVDCSPFFPGRSPRWLTHTTVLLLASTKLSEAEACVAPCQSLQQPNDIYCTTNVRTTLIDQPSLACLTVAALRRWDHRSEACFAALSPVLYIVFFVRWGYLKTVWGTRWKRLEPCWKRDENV
jgi:hypothetical protein